MRAERTAPREAGPAEPVALRLASGEWRRGPLSAAQHAELYPLAIHSGASGLVEVTGGERKDRLYFIERDPSKVKPERRKEVAQAFSAAGDRAAFVARAMALAARGLEVFTRPVTVETPDPTQDAVIGGRVAWVDVDEPANVDRLRAFHPRPHLVVFSGGSGGAHGYWRLSGYVHAERLESINRRLAAEIGADKACANRGRLMRVPGTLNYKGEPSWCRVAYCDLAAPAVDPEFLETLPDPKEPVVVRTPTRFKPLEGTLLEQIPPREYFSAIVGEQVPASGFVRCPHADHDDRHPSAFVFEEAGKGWFCFSCEAGGSAIDLYSAVNGGPTRRELRGEAFTEAELGALRALGLDDEAERIEKRVARKRRRESRKSRRAAAAAAGSPGRRS